MIARRTSVHSYRFRNIRANIILVAMFVAVGGAFIVGEEMNNNFTCSLEPHKVQQGDTLWGIAEQNCEGDIQRVTDNLSGVYGSTIQPGWDIYLPENENCLLKLVDGQILETCGN